MDDVFKALDLTTVSKLYIIVHWMLLKLVEFLIELLTVVIHLL